MKDAVKYALSTMKIEGFVYSEKEKKMWSKIAAGELSLEAARQDAAEFNRQMREKYPEKFVEEEV